MRRNFHFALLNAIYTAAKNGNDLAEWVWNEINKEDEDDIFTEHGKQDNFRLVLPEKPSDPLMIAYTNFDFDNPVVSEMLAKDPDLRYKPKRYKTCSISTFLNMFLYRKYITITDKMLEEFMEDLRVGSELKCIISDDYYDFQYAYLYRFYAPWYASKDNTLHKSCMQKAQFNGVIPEFYRYICGCKILMVLDSSCRVVGRAIIWPDAILETGSDGEVHSEKVSVISRIYATCIGVKNFIIRSAVEAGISIRAIHNPHNDYKLQVLNGEDYDMQHVLRFKTKLHFSSLYQGGIPYVDFFSQLWLENNELYLSTAITEADDAKYPGTFLGYMDKTSGRAAIYKHICPNCGQTLTWNEWLCPDCMEKLNCMSPLYYCPVLTTTFVEGYGRVPEILVDENGALKHNAELALLVKRFSGIGVKRDDDMDEKPRYFDEVDHETVE